MQCYCICLLRLSHNSHGDDAACVTPVRQIDANAPACAWAKPKSRPSKCRSLDPRQHRPDSFNCEGHNGAGPQNRGNQTNTDQQDGKILGRLTNNVARDFRHTLTNSGRHETNKAPCRINGKDRRSLNNNATTFAVELDQADAHQKPPSFLATAPNKLD